MSKKLFVGGLSWNTTEDELRKAFERFGEISELKIITERETGRSRGFAFVSYGDPSNANRAMSEMDGTEMDGRTLKVNEAQEKSGGGGRGHGPGGGRGGYGGRSGKRSDW